MSRTTTKPKTTKNDRQPDTPLDKAMIWRNWFGLVALAAELGVTFEEARGMCADSEYDDRAGELGDQILASMVGCETQDVEGWIERALASAFDVDTGEQNFPPVEIARLLNALPSLPITAVSA